MYTFIQIVDYVEEDLQVVQLSCAFSSNDSTSQSEIVLHKPAKMSIQWMVLHTACPKADFLVESNILVHINCINQENKTLLDNTGPTAGYTHGGLLLLGDSKTSRFCVIDAVTCREGRQKMSSFSELLFKQIV